MCICILWHFWCPWMLFLSSRIGYNGLGVTALWQFLSWQFWSLSQSHSVLLFISSSCSHHAPPHPLPCQSSVRVRFQGETSLTCSVIKTYVIVSLWHHLPITHYRCSAHEKSLTFPKNSSARDSSVNFSLSQVLPPKGEGWACGSNGWNPPESPPSDGEVLRSYRA